MDGIYTRTSPERVMKAYWDLCLMRKVPVLMAVAEGIKAVMCFDSQDFEKKHGRNKYSVELQGMALGKKQTENMNAQTREKGIKIQFELKNKINVHVYLPFNIQVNALRDLHDQHAFGHEYDCKVVH